MKAAFIIAFLISFLLPGADFKKVLCSYQWRAKSMKEVFGTHDPNTKLPPRNFYNTAPFCGQIIRFNDDHTCSIEEAGRGKGMWSDIDKCTWSIEEEGAIRFTHKEYLNQSALQILSFNKDSIVFFQRAIGYETGKLMVTVFTLERVNAR